MKFRFAAVAALTLALFSGALQANAQENPYDDARHIPTYTSWQTSWDRDDYDREHVILGTVAKFSPYRLTIVRRDGVIQTLDLKNGTVIRPLGATPTVTQHVAAVGYYSKGTFIVNRIVLRY